MQILISTTGADPGRFTPVYVNEFGHLVDMNITEARQGCQKRRRGSEGGVWAKFRKYEALALSLMLKTCRLSFEKDTCYTCICMFVCTAGF